MKTWHFFEEQVSPTSSFLRHVAGGGDKLDWLEELKSTEKKDGQRERETVLRCSQPLEDEISTL